VAGSAITFSPGEVSTYYSARVPHLKQRDAAEWRGPCPIHNGKRDSFAVEPETGRWHCFSTCARGGDIIVLEEALTGGDFKTAKAEVFRIVGRSESSNGNRGRPRSARIAATYDFTDESGSLLYQCVRMEPKDFRQRRPNGKGGWLWNLDGIERVPYRLPNVLKADTVYLPEGEKDVHTLEAWGLVASCNPGGSSNGHLYTGWGSFFQGRHIVILPDNDEPGRKHAATVAAALFSVAASVRLLELPGLRAKGDVSDWRDGGGTFEQLRKLVDAAVPLDAVALFELRARWGLAGGGSRQAERAGAPDDWPKPEPIQGELPPVTTFSEEILPLSFRPLVRDVTERMQVPMDYPAVVMVLCLAGAVNRRATVQPKAHDTGWVVVPNLWGGIIAPPGLMKSPVIQAVCRPLNQIQTVWRQEHEEALAGYALAKEESELQRAAWREQYKASAKKGKVAPDRPAHKPEEPKLRRLIVNDATFEALHQTMSENPAGILVIRDELTGWWSQLDRAGREGERAFCLQAWNGDTGHTIDRIARGTIHVEACCMSMLGGIQPGRLRSYLADALKDGPSNDGLIQRFQLLVWPDTAPDWEYVDRPPDPASELTAERVFRNLVQWDTEGPMRYRFAADAQGLFVDWLARLEARVRGEELHPALVSHLSKYRSLMPSLALLFELADRAAVGSPSLEGESGDSDQCACISLEHAEQAVAWCDYLESHARRIYSCITTPQLRAAQAFAEKLKKRQIAPDGFFSCRDVYLKGWSGLDAPELVRMAVEVLQDAGWIRDVDRESGPLGGRPSARYQVNPRAWE
jgi:putative DNA primase/helicase